MENGKPTPSGEAEKAHSPQRKLEQAEPIQLTSRECGESKTDIAADVFATGAWLCAFHPVAPATRCRRIRG